ncbi:hypothetical protein Lal_00003484 [Lupinus albus]|nr:hypothetical protein Lal_00003484 [Lupinus albus]
MEGNDHLPPQPPPQQPPPEPNNIIYFYRNGNPYQPFGHIAAGTTFPITITIHNTIKLYFTITRNNVTITTSIHNAPHLHIIHQHLNHNNGAHHNNMNNGEALHLHNNGEALDFEYIGEPLHFHDNREALLVNLPNFENGNRDTIEIHDLLSQFHGLDLTNLPTLPSFIHITSNNKTFSLHLIDNNAIYVYDRTLPVPRPQNDDNYHVINQPFTIPLTIILLFGNPNNNTYISIAIEFRTNNAVFIYANAHIGPPEFAAILEMLPQD